MHLDTVVKKCSACSIVYISEKDRHLFINLLKKNLEIFKHLNSYRNYGLIDKNSYARTEKVINKIKYDNKKYKIVSGGHISSLSTYFIEPTIWNVQIILILYLIKNFLLFIYIHI